MPNVRDDISGSIRPIKEDVKSEINTTYYLQSNGEETEKAPSQNEPLFGYRVVKGRMHTYHISVNHKNEPFRQNNNWALASKRFAQSRGFGVTDIYKVISVNKEVYQLYQSYLRNGMNPKYLNEILRKM